MGNILYFIGLFFTLFIASSLVIALFESFTELKLGAIISKYIKTYVLTILVIDLLFTVIKQVYAFNLLFILGTFYQYIVMAFMIVGATIIVFHGIFVKDK